MHATITLISLLNYIGTTAFLIEGILTAKKLHLGCFLQFLSGMNSAFFGGAILRDLILLQTPPILLQNPQEIVAAMSVCIFTIVILKYKEPGRISLTILCLLDSIGIVSSVVAGYNQGTKSSIMFALICSFITACGGGIATTFIQMIVTLNLKSYPAILTNNRWYYLFAASISVAYGIIDWNGYHTNSSIIVLTVIAVIMGFIVKLNNKKPKYKR